MALEIKTQTHLEWILVGIVHTLIITLLNVGGLSSQVLGGFLMKLLNI
jgi:hypothetical protein